MKRPRLTRKSGFSRTANLKQTAAFGPSSLGQSCPQHCPRFERSRTLGEPLAIREAARLIGVSVWTVRQTLIPLGLPVFRSGANGKLIFYRDQVLRWIESKQGEHA
jgi:hypothetical protein